MYPAGAQLVIIESLKEGAPKEDGATIPAGIVDKGMATAEAGKTVEARGTARRRIGRGATEGRGKTIAEQGNQTSPMNKRAGRPSG